MTDEQHLCRTCDYEGDCPVQEIHEAANDIINACFAFKKATEESNSSSMACSIPWVSVKNRLPEDEDQLMVCYRGDVLGNVQYLPDSEEWWDCGSANYLNAGSVTHWHPMPKPPRN